MVDRINLAPDYTISRIIKGGWHLAGGHGTIDPEEAIADMRAFAAEGITTFDCADIYTGVEELIGRFLRKEKDAFASGNLPPIQIHTKYVPDYDALPTLTKEDTESIIDRSLRRLGVEQLDLVQFAWWDYSYPLYLDAAFHLKQLQDAGKIRYVALTNFDAEHTREILDTGVQLVANQVQYSVLDCRPARDMQELASDAGFSFLCYGVLAGGFLSDKFLGTPPTTEPLENRSLTKYRLIIEEFGGYAAYQHLMRTLRAIADKYGCAIAEVATAYILQKPKVAGVIIGARHSGHLPQLADQHKVFIDSADMELIDTITASAPGPRGPVYALERDKNGPHGSIMRYNLNGQRHG